MHLKLLKEYCATLSQRLLLEAFLLKSVLQEFMHSKGKFHALSSPRIGIRILERRGDVEWCMGVMYDLRLPRTMQIANPE